MSTPFEIRETLEDSWHGHRLVVEPLTGRNALTAAYRFSKYLGSAIGKLTSVAETQGISKKPQSLLDSDIDLEAVIRAFFDNCTEREFVEFSEMLLKSAKINNVQMALESNHFLGFPERIFELLFIIIRYQFSGFFSALKTKMPNVKI